MQNSEPAAEPSMEELLASIRKIIADDPNAASPVAGAGASPSTAAADLAQAKPVMSNRLSEVVRALAPSAVPVGTKGPVVPVDDDFAELVEPAEASAAPVRALPPVKASTSAPKIAEPISAPTRASVAAAPAIVLPPAVREAIAKAPEAKSADLGAFVPGAAEPPASAAAYRSLPSTIAADFRAADSAKTAKAAFRGVEASATPLAAATPLRADATAGLDAAQSALGVLAAGLAAPSSKPGSDESAPAASKTSLDEQIVGMIRPMVRDWLDANLPQLVERALADEMKRRGH